MSDSDILLNFRKGWWDFSVIEIFENYGWYLLIFAIVIIYVYRRSKPSIDQFLKDKADREYAAKYHKNPDLAVVRIAAQQAATQKLQEKYNKNATEYQRKMEEKEERRRQEILSQPGNNGYRLGSASTSNEQKSLRQEYNPLMGDNSRSYKPQKKSACSGGGCGKK